MEAVVQEVITFLSEFLKQYYSFTSIRARLQTLDTLWEEFLPIREKTILQLQTMTKILEQRLENSKVIKASGM